MDFADAIRRAAGAPNAPIRRFPWPAVYLASPFVETFREMLEMRYLWQRSLELDGGKLRAFLGEVPHTPLEHALEVTLSALGGMARPGAAASPARGRAG